MTCAVGPNILKFIAPIIAKGIDGRQASGPLAVIACENAIGATDTLAGFIRDAKNTKLDRLDSLCQRARFGNSAIDRIVPVQDSNVGLDVEIESFFEWVIDKSDFAGIQHPEIVGVQWVDDLTPYIERKLFTVNTAHAAAAYYGHNRGKRTIHEALADKEIHRVVHEALAETSQLIVNKHGITVRAQQIYVYKIIERISNPHLEDIVERVGRAPLRKLSRKERFIGPAAELAHRGEPVDALLGAIEMAFRFQNIEGDDESFELAKILKEHDAKSVVEKVCGLEETDALYPSVLKVVEKVQGSPLQNGVDRGIQNGDKHMEASMEKGTENGTMG